MAITKKDANAKYDKLRKQLKIGAIDKETFKRSANAIYKKYHSKSNKATRNAPTSKPKASKPKASSSAGKQRFFDGAKGGKYDKAVQNKEKAKSNFFRSSSGTRGKNLPSNPKLKSQDTSRLTGRQKIALEVNAAAGGKSSHKRSRNKLKVVKRNRRGRRM